MDEVGQAGNDASASAEMSASIMPAYRAGVERSGVERVGVPSDAAVPVPTHAELLESLRVARGGGAFRSGPGTEAPDGYSPRDGHMAFVRSPDNISIELLQAGPALPPAEPWASMPNVGVW